MSKKFKAGLPSEVLPSMIDPYDAINNDRVIEPYLASIAIPTNKPGGRIPVRKHVRRAYTVDDMIENLTRISKKGKNIPVYIMGNGQSKTRTIPGKVLYDGRKGAAAIICDGCEYSEIFEVSTEEYHTNIIKCTALNIIKKYKLIKLMQVAVNRTADVMGDGMPSLDDIVATKQTGLNPNNVVPETFGKIMNYLNEALADGPDTNTVTAQINSIKLIKNSKKVKSTLVFGYTVKKISNKGE